MKLFVQQHKYFLFLLLAFFVAELITDPLGEFPLVDDWAYAQAVDRYDQTGRINFDNFPAMTLYTQIMWGYLFIKAFGFSLWVLRCSTLVSALIGLFFLNKLVTLISGNRAVGALSCFVLLFVPLVFNLSNTFMTDVNFNTLLIVCCYLLYKYFRTYHAAYYIGFALASTALVLLRQYGIIFPACLVAASFFAGRRKALHVVLALVTFAAVILVLKQYEHYLAQELPKLSTYKFSGDVSLLDPAFWNKLLDTFAQRWKEITVQSLMYLMPFAVIFLPALLKVLSYRISLPVLLLSAAATWLIFSSEGLRSDTIFSYMIVGVETFYSSFKGARHNVSDGFTQFMAVFRCLSVGLTLFEFFLGLVKVTMDKKWKTFFRPEVAGFVLLVAAYVFMLLITDSYFDRYHIPLISMGLVLAAYLARTAAADIRLSVVPIVFWAWVSIFGTKDYLEWNRQRWKAYWFLRRDLNVPMDQINAGFEVKCWNEGHGVGWVDFLSVDHTRYLVQFDPEPGFESWRCYEFQRYFPYKKDKVCIFVRKGSEPAIKP